MKRGERGLWPALGQCGLIIIMTKLRALQRYLTSHQYDSVVKVANCKKYLN